MVRESPRGAARSRSQRKDRARGRSQGQQVGQAAAAFVAAAAGGKFEGGRVVREEECQCREGRENVEPGDA